jgi:hypothetical protein
VAVLAAAWNAADAATIRSPHAAAFEVQLQGVLPGLLHWKSCVTWGQLLLNSTLCWQHAGLYLRAMAALSCDHKSSQTASTIHASGTTARLTCISAADASRGACCFRCTRCSGGQVDTSVPCCMKHSLFFTHLSNAHSSDIGLRMYFHIALPGKLHLVARPLWTFAYSPRVLQEYVYCVLYLSCVSLRNTSEASAIKECGD